MKTTTRRIVSLILAIVMACSVMGVMAFAAISTELYWCEICKDEVYAEYTPESQVQWSFERVVECPYHSDHDAEMYTAYTDCLCVQCDNEVYAYEYTKYVCLP